jgi:hypothetical protein
LGKIIVAERCQPDEPRPSSWVFDCLGGFTPGLISGIVAHARLNQPSAEKQKITFRRNAIRDRLYRGGRQKHWIKVKNRKHQAFERVKETFS